MVAPATKAKVEASVRALGYRPNSVARALRERATKVLALVVPDAVNPFYAQLAHGMERRARREGFGVLVAHTGCDPSTELAQVTALMSRRADGVLLGGLSHSSTLHLRLLDEGVPVVCGFAADDERFGVIDTDDATGMAAIMDHLGGPGPPARRVRRAGLRGGRRGAAQDGLRGGGGEPGHDGRRARGRARPPWSRTTTPWPIGELDRLHRSGLRVPQDVSVTGYDDIALASHALIGLTTVGTDAELAGEVAAEQLILAVREHRHVRHRHLQPARLAVRATTGPAPRRPG